mgnify:CR=1 FL=1
MVTIIVTGDESLMPYWKPLLAKYKNDPKYQFLFVEDEEDVEENTKTNMRFIN